MLDLVVEPDRSWRWKDKHELETPVRRGMLDAHTIDHIQADADAVVARIDAGEPPFCAPWPSWIPKREWSTPSLPHGWDTIAPAAARRRA
jgi:hypothetical protein